MAHRNRKVHEEMVQGILLDDPAFLKEIVERVLQELLEAEMTEHIGAAPYERTENRKGQRNGYKPRTLRTRVGTLNLAVPQDREGSFSTRLFARYQRNEKALVLALMQMYRGIVKCCGSDLMITRRPSPCCLPQALRFRILLQPSPTPPTEHRLASSTSAQQPPST